MRHFCHRCKVWEWERDPHNLPKSWMIVVIIINGTVANIKLCKGCVWLFQRFTHNEPVEPTHH